MLVGEIEGFEGEGGIVDLDEKRVEVSVVGNAREVEGGEVWEPVEEAREERESLIGDCEGAFQMVADGEELFGDGGERF